VPGPGAGRRRGILYHLALFLAQFLPAWAQEDEGGRFYRHSHTRVREYSLIETGVRRYLAPEAIVLG
jgi:hypothetical protein